MFRPRTRPATPARRPVRVLSMTNHWVVDGDRFYRTCTVRLPDGTVATRHIATHLLAAA